MVRLPIARGSTTLLTVALIGRSSTQAAFATVSSSFGLNKEFETVSFLRGGGNHVHSPRLLTSVRKSTTPLRMSSSDSSTKKRVLVPIAAGSEEIETTSITDTLTRFGAEVVVASVMPGGEKVCKMSRGIQFLADTTIDEAAKEQWDLIVLPGGMPGAEHLRDCDSLISLLQKQKDSGKMYGAVCASPSVVLASKGLVDSGATCYPAPGFREAMKNPVDDEVVVQGNLVTSQGPGTSLKFALKLGEQMFGKEKADEIAKQMLVQR